MAVKDGVVPTMPQTLRAPIAGRAAPPGLKGVIPAKKIAHADRIPQSDLRFARDLIRKRKAALSIRRATMDDLPTILHLIDEAKGWLKSKDTDQWSTDWLDKDGRRRSDRVECSLKERPGSPTSASGAARKSRWPR